MACSYFSLLGRFWVVSACSWRGLQSSWFVWRCLTLPTRPACDAPELTAAVRSPPLFVVAAPVDGKFVNSWFSHLWIIGYGFYFFCVDHTCLDYLHIPFPHHFSRNGTPHIFLFHARHMGLGAFCRVPGLFPLVTFPPAAGTVLLLLVHAA